MLKKTMTYVDYDGNERTEDFYFNLTKAELTELQLSTEGGLKAMLEKIVQSKDVVRVVEWFKKIILMSYGQKSADGRRFIKTKELTEEFTQTEAYSDLYMELATNEKAASDFINRILPNIDKPNVPAPKVME